MKKPLKDSFIIGFALFSMFFGAGNVIFPPYLGLESGPHWLLGFISYYIADIGLALLAMFAILRQGSPEKVTSRIGKVPSVLLMCAIVLCIGPMLAIPRTAATTFETSVTPLVSGVSPVLFSVLFFLLILLLCVRERAVVDIVGKILTPALLIGLLSAAVITVLGVAYGCLSGIAPARTDALLMRLVELVQSIPVLLVLLLAVSLLGPQNALSIALLIGVTGWFALARIVRGEVRQIRHSEYILASRCMGGSFGWIMRRHLVPNVVSAILFVVISAVSTSIAMESTLSFLGLGLPVDELSWGSMLALADKALLLNTWWVILIPGLFLVTALLCITSLGHHFRRNSVRGPSNL